MKKYKIRKNSPLWWARKAARLTIIAALILCIQGTTIEPTEITAKEPATIPQNEPQYEELEIPGETPAAKTYMSVHKITNKRSSQYQFIHHSGEITIDEKGYLRDAQGFYGVALGSYFGPIGSRYIFTLDNGTKITVCKVEAKADVDTDENGYMCIHDGSVIEFVVDTTADYMQENIWPNGYIFQGNFNNNPEFEGRIVKIEKVLSN